MHASVCRPHAGIPIALVLSAFLCIFQAHASTYFISTNGSDSNAGTSLSMPFQTIQQAAGIMRAGDICFIESGAYHESLTPSNSGTSSAPITFTAFSNELVTIDGADPVADWTQDLTNSTYQAPVNWNLGEGCNQVFVDGVMMHEAQYPVYGNGGLLNPATVSVVVNSTNTNLITSAAFAGEPDNYWAGAWFVGGVGFNWAWQSGRVLASTNNTITVDPATETTNWWFTGGGSGYLWGLLSLLDADNEWCLQTNSTGGTLYLRIAGGGNPSSHLVEMKHRNWCVDLNHQNNIIISNLNFQAGAVRLNGYGDVLQNCQAQFLSHFRIIGQGYFENDGTDQGCGVKVGGTNDIVRGCVLFNTAGSGIYSIGTSNLITRNLIYDTDYSGTYAAPIVLHGNHEIVTFNTAYASGRDILRPEGTASLICFNDLSQPGFLCHDLGVIYAWGINARASDGTSTRIAYNWIHDNTNSLSSPLIYLDNYDANFVIDHNVCWNNLQDSGIRINAPALGHLIYNNTLFNCYDVGTHTYDSWPGGNPNTAFWTNDVDQYSASNNLFLAATPQAQLVNCTNDDFQLLPNAPAINAGVVIPGFTDGYVGAAPDLGAYEFGDLPWSAGINSKPALAIAPSLNGGLELMASPAAAYYQLFIATSLASSQWMAMTNAPLALADQWFLTLPVSSNQSSFYRLQQ